MRKQYKGEARWALHKLTYALWMTLFNGMPPHPISTGPKEKDTCSS